MQKSFFSQPYCLTLKIIRTHKTFMKKLFLLLMAVGAMTLVSCTGNAEKASGSAASPAQEENAEPAKGTVFEGANFTMTYPEILTKEGYKSDKAINASSEDNAVKMDATFSDMPCKPEDFDKYYKNFTGMSMNSEYKWEDAKIKDNILTFKGVKGEDATTNFVVFLDEKGGVAGKINYPVAKAEEIEALIEPMLKSIKKK